MESVTNIDAIMNPKDAFLDYKKYLLWQYTEDYGENNSRLISERINNTIYLFESPPPDKMQFITNHFYEISDYKKMLRIENEFQDYIKIKKKIDAILKKKLYEKIAYYFHLTANKVKYEELVYLDFDAFSLESIKLLKSEDIDEKIKEEILKRQERYLNTCKLYGLEPITDWRMISRLKKYGGQLNFFEKVSLIKHSKWGKRILKEVNAQSKIKITAEHLAEIIFCDKTASTNTIATDEIICYFPVMKVSSVGETDRLFFHENRHVVETNENSSGIDAYPYFKYTMLNEVRTEKNAGLDSQNLATIPLFSTAPLNEKRFNCYQIVFPYTGDFFERYRKELNDFAIENDVLTLEYLYGEDNLLEFNDYLQDIEYSFIRNQGNSHLPVNPEKQKKLLFQLNESYHSKKNK